VSSDISRLWIVLSVIRWLGTVLCPLYKQDSVATIISRFWIVLCPKLKAHYRESVGFSVISMV
jgi:hypothetical protein